MQNSENGWNIELDIDDIVIVGDKVFGNRVNSGEKGDDVVEVEFIIEVGLVVNIDFFVEVVWLLHEVLIVIYLVFKEFYVLLDI